MVKIQSVIREESSIQGFDVLLDDKIAGQFRTFLEAFAFAEGCMEGVEGILVKNDAVVFMSCSFGIPWTNELSYAWRSGVDSYPGRHVVTGLIPLDKEA